MPNNYTDDNYISQRLRGKQRLRKGYVYIMLKYTNDEIQSFISPFGLYLDFYEGTKKIFAHDAEGYKYRFALSNVKMGRKPDWLQGNPFAIDNIRNYLSIHCPYYELLDNEYVSCKAKMRFICHKHEEKGIQLNSFDNIVHNGHVCKYCGYENLARIKQISEERLVSLCEKKNLIYVGNILKNGQTYVLYKCKEHSSVIQEMSLDHFRDSINPCRLCQITSGELRIRQFLDAHRIPYDFQHIFPDCRHIRTLEFDFYLPTKHIVIEYDGKQHFEKMGYRKTEEENIRAFELCKTRDKIKDYYCNSNNIKMIRVPYWDYNNIEQILSKEII